MTYQFHTEPFPHQAETFEQSKDLPSFAILWEQGCGKTKLGIDTACHLWEEGKIDAVIVVAPNGVHRNWLTDELPTHMPLRIRPKVRAKFWDGPRSKNVGHKREVEQLMKHDGFAWLMISYDSFMTKHAKDYIWKFLRHRRVLYILDEAHNIKTPSAKRTISIVASGKYAPYRRIMTGTPVATGPFDVYSPIRFLDEGFWQRLGLGSFRVFKFHFANYFTAQDCLNLHGYDPGYDKLLGYKNIDELNGHLMSISSRVTKDEVLSLPPKLYSTRYCPLTQEQRQVYDELKREFMAELSDGSVIDGNLAIVRMLRFQQVICGYAHTDDESEPVRQIGGSNPRLNLLKEIVEDIHHPTIIWARFTKDVDQIMELLGDQAVRYDGAMSDDECAASKLAFQQPDGPKFFVGNPAKGKEGLTLTRARNVIYYSNSFKLIDRLQSEDRAHRIGQEHPVSYIDIVCPETIDEHIVRSLRNKHDIAAQVTGDKLKEWL